MVTRTALRKRVSVALTCDRAAVLMAQRDTLADASIRTEQEIALLKAERRTDRVTAAHLRELFERRAGLHVQLRALNIELRRIEYEGEAAYWRMFWLIAQRELDADTFARLETLATDRCAEEHGHDYPMPRRSGRPLVDFAVVP